MWGENYSFALSQAVFYFVDTFCKSIIKQEDPSDLKLPCH